MEEDDEAAEERARLRQAARADEALFPDEIELREKELGRERMARYRSLTNYQTSRWDPKENLPEDYARVWHVGRYRKLRLRVAEEQRWLARRLAERRAEEAKDAADDERMEDTSEDSDDEILSGCVPAGAYVTLVLADVSAAAYAAFASARGPASLLLALPLLPHENKLGVIHLDVNVVAHDDAAPHLPPIKSKDALTFVAGHRTWRARPVFSQTRFGQDKHKFERFLKVGDKAGGGRRDSAGFVTMTTYGPLSYAPCWVLVYREYVDADGKAARQLVATGNVAGADADRIVLKRAVLTGFPSRVHKRHATVRYMFNNPEDVVWFKPAKLTTKHGLQGHIMESVGTHGSMKCLFDKPIKQHDTVCLVLYKRIFPKFAPPVEVIQDDGTVVKKCLVIL
uniref:Ribosome biogenesis protein BMS1/TSR1 C-terminal domain-containing protein n=2 Tax=Corethron hystrix TaxID=216773 RepID=A0A7S1BMZ9_9STRA|mmetsp:Transcript_33094/g.76267  ORF Transcript_33094/g.76267 Transcript_33094/m.76267 type:complete len:397 (+) Transcript_33094:447-1637(+)